MTPDDSFVEEDRNKLNDVRDNLVRNLTPQDIEKIDEQANQLNKAQDVKDEDLSSLPTLNMIDIPFFLPEYSYYTMQDNHKTSLSVQPTKGVTYFRALLLSHSFYQKEVYLKYLPLFLEVLTKLGAGPYDYKSFDTQIDLFTNGLNVGFHGTNFPFRVKQKKNNNPERRESGIENGIYLSSYCLDRNVEKMFSLWTHLFNELKFKDIDRIKTILSMRASEAVNGVVYSGHQYAMKSSAASLSVMGQLEENFGGLSHVKNLVKYQNPDNVDEKMVKAFEKFTKLFNKKNILTMMNVGSDNADNAMKHCENFLNNIEGGEKHFSNHRFNIFTSNNTEKPSFVSKKYYSTPFPVHYVGKSIPTVCYDHPDHAPLRILAKLISSKYLHTEIREKGGAYGGGAVMSETGKTFSYYSYRDPNMDKTLDAYDSATHWILKNTFSDQDIQEAKLGVFKGIDSPVVPSERGKKYFLTGISDADANEHRKKLRGVNREDLIRVASDYLLNPSQVGISVIGPESSAPKDGDYIVESLEH